MSMSVKSSSVLMPANEGPVAQATNTEADAAIVLICEHASSYIPNSLADLGLAQDARYSHIAWDIGAYDLAIALS